MEHIRLVYLRISKLRSWMEDRNDDTLLISGIQHFAFCRRRWALIYIEQQWTDNFYTISGQLLHARAHDKSIIEKRGSLLITRDMPVFSKTLGIQGSCDVVEFNRDINGVAIHGREGLWLPCPVEYKKGGDKSCDADKYQLCAQAMCLEEMLACLPIEMAYIYHGDSKRREIVELKTDLRNTVRTIVEEMHNYYERRHTPRVKPKKACSSCSLKDICIPKMPQEGHVSAYIQNALNGEL